MNDTSSVAAKPAELAKVALRQIMLHKLEPTPENYARAYRSEAGQATPSFLPIQVLPLLEHVVGAAFPEADAAERQALARALLDGHWERAERALAVLKNGESQATALASLIESIVRGVERGGRIWTSGRRKESVLRVLAGSRIDARVLQRRLAQLVASWDSGGGASVPAALGDVEVAPASPVDAPPTETTAPSSTGHAQGSAPAAWARALTSLAGSVQAALPATEAGELRASLSAAVQSLATGEATAEQADALAQLCERADPALQHRHHLVDQLGALCLELTSSMGDLAEEESWVKGQLDAMRSKLEEGITARGVRSVAELLRETRAQQSKLRSERGNARDALKSMIGKMLLELGELGSRTGRFHDNVGRYAEVIDRADSLESLTAVVGEMLEETRNVQEIVGQTQTRLQAEHKEATKLSERVTELESELRRLSEEVSTDQLTQIANRRGMMQAFEVARAGMERDAKPLAIGLLDVDNFKRLNDELGHQAGDEALRSLAAAVTKALRPADVVARFGGEEFVVILPATSTTEGQQILTRLQRSLTEGLFMHEHKTVFVTFSAGVTAYRTGETIAQALERADEALYEAKRTGKNRTCIS